MRKRGIETDRESESDTNLCGGGVVAVRWSSDFIMVGARFLSRLMRGREGGHVAKTRGGRDGGGGANGGHSGGGRKVFEGE